MNTPLLRLFALIYGAISALSRLAAAEAPLTDEQNNFFERKIRPVLIEKCYECHSAQSKKVKGGLMLDTKESTLLGGDNGPAVVPGKIDESLLIEAIRYANKDMEMPPKGKLPDSVISDLEAWVKMGAPDPRGGSVADAAAASAQWKKKEIDIAKGRAYWAYQRPVKRGAPSVKNSAWPKSDIDRYVLAKLEDKGLSPVADATKLDLLRRVTFDLTGLPPAIDAIQAFLKDTAPGAIERVVDNLLASERFGEYWGRHWLDVARYGESSGKDVNLPYPFAWRYRDWVIKALNEDMPYNEFVRQQIAGDILPFKDVRDQSEKIVATGFLAIGTKPHNERNRRQFALEVADEQIDTISQAFLATTIACARCHDHKFDPIPQKDYYALAGIMLSSETLFGTTDAVQNNNGSDLIDLGRESGLAAGFESISAAERASLQRRYQQLADTRTTKQREAFTQRAAGKEVNIFQLLVVRQQIGDAQGELNRYDEQGNARILAMGVYDQKYPINSPVYNRGEATQPSKDTVPRGFVQVFFPSVPPHITKGSGRLDLANWLASSENPQTARVMVNRTWRWLFARGIVATVDNFGVMGEKPTHPELLDHLAIRFMESDWNIKKLVREIVLSRTYQLASQHVPQNFAADPENTLFWRMNTRSLDAESLRDAMLTVSGKIDLYPPDGSPVSRVGEGREGLFRLFQLAQQPSYTRSIYLPIIRDNVPEALALFDFANPGLVTGDRESTNVPSQSLYLMNNDQVVSLSDAFARRVYDSAKDNPSRVANAYWMAFGRAPTPQEALATRTFFSEYSQDAGKAKATKGGKDIGLYAWSAFCQALLASA
ncbi:MAG: PSD1 and planctomycete cytochrome C domain-containing protein, partial [Roseimicrobium sp.]